MCREAQVESPALMTATLASSAWRGGCRCSWVSPSQPCLAPKGGHPVPPPSLASKSLPPSPVRQRAYLINHKKVFPLSCLQEIFPARIGKRSRLERLVSRLLVPGGKAEAPLLGGVQFPFPIWDRRPLFSRGCLGRSSCGQWMVLLFQGISRRRWRRSKWFHSLANHSLNVCLGFGFLVLVLVFFVLFFFFSDCFLWFPQPLQHRSGNSIFFVVIFSDSSNIILFSVYNESALLCGE